MKNLLIDDHKLLYHEKELKSVMEGEQIVPIYVDLGIHNACNFRCVHCGPGFRGHGNHYIKCEPLLQLMKDMGNSGVKSVLIGGTGEPSLNPNMVEAIEVGKKYGLDLALTSNGALLAQDKLERILPHLTWMRFNILATSEEFFYDMHQPLKKRGNIRENVINNLRSAVEIKRKHNLDVLINVVTCVFEENFQDIESTVKLVKEIGIDYIMIKPPSVNQKNVEEYNKFNVSLFDKYKSLEKLEKYSTDEFSVFVRWNAFDDGHKKEYNKCYGLPFIWQIDGDGGVYACGSFLQEAKYCYGNINEQSFKEIVKSERTRKAMKYVEGMPDSKYCDTHCRPHTINKFLWSIKNHPNGNQVLSNAIEEAKNKSKPEHINFI
jgi:GTP 3',8-cyclase